MIEDDIQKLQEIVIALHGQLGHVWHRGSGGLTFKRRECGCGAAEACTADEYEQYPHRYEVESFPIGLTRKS